MNSENLECIEAAAGNTVSYKKSGSGPALVLVHGGFSDHLTNWEFVTPMLDRHFTTYAIARRGRGLSTATVGHGIEDEANDIVTLIRHIDAPVYLLGHSYGGHCALAAAAVIPECIRKLVVYEAPRPTLPEEGVKQLEALAAARAWEALAQTFFRDLLAVPREELDPLRASDLWPPIVADAESTLQDIRALVRYRFDPERWRALPVQVLLQVGTESPRNLYVTDALAAVLPDVQIQTLPGLAHEGMTTAPEMYADAVTEFLAATQGVT